MLACGTGVTRPPIGYPSAAPKASASGPVAENTGASPAHAGTAIATTRQTIVRFIDRIGGTFPGRGDHHAAAESGKYRQPAMHGTADESLIFHGIPGRERGMVPLSATPRPPSDGALPDE